MKAYIITGAPGTGKTTLIAELSKKGYAGLLEIPRMLIKDKIAEKMGISPFKDLNAFFELVFNEMYKQYLSVLNTDNTCFFDRSLPDVLGYYRKSNMTPPDKFRELILNSDFEKTIFFCPVWKEIYTTDAERPYPIDEIKLLGENLYKEYKELGFTIDILPKSSVEKRVEYIVKKIG